MIDSSEFVTVNNVLAEVLVDVNDKDLRSGMSKGWYISRMSDALLELALDTFFQVITRDFDFPSEKLALEMPSNAFNLREIYVFNCDCSGDTNASNCNCFASSSRWVWWKRLYNNKGMNMGSTSKVREQLNEEGTISTNGPDPYVPKIRTGSSLVYANVQNGLIMFSSGASGYTKVRLVYNGMGGEIGDEPVIPRFAKRAVVDFVVERFFSAKMAEDSRAFGTLWRKADAKLNDLRTGSWAKARRRVSKMSTWQREAMDEYVANIVHK